MRDLHQEQRGSELSLIEQLRKLHGLLDPAQRSQLLRLQGLVVLMAVVEVASVLSIGPFTALVGNIELLQGPGIMGQLYRLMGYSEPGDFLFSAGLAALGVLTLAAILSTFTVWRLSMYGARVGADLGNRLYRHYLTQPWLFHAAGNSSQLTNKITQECHRVAAGIIQPMMQVNARLVTGSLMATTLFVLNPWVAAIGLLVFVSAYWVLYKTVRRQLQHNGQSLSVESSRRLKLMNEGFGGIKDALLLGRQSHFVERFTRSNKEMARASGNSQVLSQVPRFTIELLAFGSVIGLVLYLLKAYQGDLGSILPLLSVYALAGFKLLPTVQQIYVSFSQMRGNLAALDNIYNDLKASRTFDAMADQNVERWVPRESISLREVDFTYPGADKRALHGLNIHVPVNSVVGLVGPSGAGKSTVVDLLLGLISPDRGELLIDGTPVGEKNCRFWQNSIGYVPQNIFLADASIAENIAFGLPAGEMEIKRVENAAHRAHLDEFVVNLPEGLNTRVGERGVQLSGGQRQRIGIARALYLNADVLVMDEATSALDGITEKLVMDAIHDFVGEKTILMIAHRLATIRQCDIIYFMDEGKVVEKGTYQELIEGSTSFRRMAQSA